MVQHIFLSTVNREIFMYENIHVLNIRVNKFSRVPHENILTRKFVKLKLLCTYCRLSDYQLCMPLYFVTETAKYSQIRAVCYPMQSEVSAHCLHQF